MTKRWLALTAVAVTFAFVYPTVYGDLEWGVLLALATLGGMLWSGRQARL